jgi:hypothetical protein
VKLKDPELIYDADKGLFIRTFVVLLMFCAESRVNKDSLVVPTLLLAA